LLLETGLGNDVYEIMKGGAESGTFSLNMSIGYSAKKVTIDEEAHTRTLNEVELWELSLVTFPAKIGAAVNAVKSIEDAKNLREIEGALRESGFSKMEAQQMIRVIKTSLRESKEKDDDVKPQPMLDGILSSLQQVNSSF
jgi:hypothetical protein